MISAQENLAPVYEIEDQPVETDAGVDQAMRDAYRLIDNEDQLDLETRIGVARSLVANHPEVGELWSVLAELRMEAGDDAEALMAFERAVAKDETISSSWHWIGIINKRMGKYNEAIMAFNKAIEYGEPKAVELNEIAIAHTRQQNINKALEVWVEAIEVDPDWGVLFANAIKAATIVGRDDLARSLFIRSLSAERFEERAALIWTDYLVAEGDRDEAIEDYKLAIQQRPDAARLQYYYAATLREMGDDEEALIEFEKAISVANADGDRMTQAAAEKAAFALKHPDKIKVLEKTEKYINKEELDSDKDIRRVRESIEEITEILDEHPNLWEPMLMRGVGYRRLGEWNNAKADFEKVLELAPDQPNAILNIGLIHQDMGEFEKASERAEQAIEIAPNDPFIQMNAIFIFINTQQCDKAVNAINNAGNILSSDLLEVLESALQGACQ